MKIRDFADPAVPVVEPDMSVLRAIESLEDQRSGYAFVISCGQPVGVFERDQVLGLVAAIGRELGDLTVGQVMSSNVSWFYWDWELEEVAVGMAEKGVEHSIIRDSKGRILGFVELAHLIKTAAHSIPFPKLELAARSRHAIA